MSADPSTSSAAPGAADPPSLPPWYDSSKGLLLSAVSYLDATFESFHWTGVYLLQDDVLKLGPYIGEPTDHTTIPVGRGVCGTAVAEGRTQNIPDVSALTNYLSCSAKTRSELVVLIREPGSGRILGQIDIDSHVAAAFGAREEAEVDAVAGEVGRFWGKVPL
jgi:L-methionine (R)-S-oxide reductase